VIDNRTMDTADPKQVWVMDGGMGHELGKRMEREKQDPTEGWIQLHVDYVQAGADLITTHSFVDTPALPPSRRNQNQKGEQDQDGNLHSKMRRAGQVAREAADKAPRKGTNKPVLVAASLPPTYSCYVPPKEPRDWMAMENYYDVAVQALVPFADLFLCETMPTSQQAIAAADKACATGKPVYVSYTLEDRNETDVPTLRGGETLHDAIATTLNRVSSIEGILVNCCAPESITGAMPVLAQMVGARGLRYGGYGNAFWHTTSSWMEREGHGGTPREGAAQGNAPEPLQTHRQRSDFDGCGIMMPRAYCAYVRRWVAEFGATLVGGCCGTGPMHIRAVRDCVDEYLTAGPCA